MEMKVRALSSSATENIMIKKFIIFEIDDDGELHLRQ